MLFFHRFRYRFFQEVFLILCVFTGSICLVNLLAWLIQVLYSMAVYSVGEIVIQFEFCSLCKSFLYIEQNNFLIEPFLLLLSSTYFLLSAGADDSGKKFFSGTDFFIFS